MEAGDRLLADVAALLKLTARSTMPASAGIVSAPISAPKRGRPASMRRISAASAADLDGAGLDQRLAQAAGAGAVGDQVEAVPGPSQQAIDAVHGRPPAGVLRQRRRRGDLGAARPDQREDRPLGAQVGDLHLPADPVGLRWRRAVSSASGSVSIQISSAAMRRTRMSAWMWPLRSSSAA